MQEVNVSEVKKGIFVVVQVKCTSDIPFEKTWSFWLPQNVINASLSLREKLHANRVFDIPDEQCVKQVTFYIKNAKPTPGFGLILNGLRKAGVDYRIVGGEWEHGVV